MSIDEGNSQIESEASAENGQMMTIVYIAGCSGAGKTTLARWLSEHLDWCMLNKDHIKLELLKEYQFELLKDPDEINRMLDTVSLRAFDLFFQRLEQCIEAGCSVIVDNWGYVNNHGSVETTLSHILAIMSEHPGKVQLKVIHCQASKETRDQRIVRRGSQLWPYLYELPETPDDKDAGQKFVHLQKVDRLELNTGDDGHEVLERNGLYALEYLGIPVPAPV